MRIRGKKCLFFGKFIVPCFLETPVLIFAFLLYYRRVMKHRTMVAQRQFVYFIVAICRKTLKIFFFLILPFFPIILLFAPMILLENQFYEDFSWFLIQSMMLFFLKMCEMCFRNVISSFK